VNAEESVWTNERKGITNYTPIFTWVNRSKTVRWTGRVGCKGYTYIYINVQSEKLSDREFFIQKYMVK